MKRDGRTASAGKLLALEFDNHAGAVGTNQRRVLDRFFMELGDKGCALLLAYLSDARGHARVRGLRVNLVLLKKARLRARDAFGDADAAERWLVNVSVPLGAAPIELLGTEGGLARILKELAAIEHGLPI